MWHSNAMSAIDVFSGKNRISKLARALTTSVALLSAASVYADDPVAPRPDWTTDDMRSQDGRIALVTGGTSGMGYFLGPY